MTEVESISSEKMVEGVISLFKDLCEDSIKGANEDPLTSFSKIANKMMSNGEKIFGRNADVITFGQTQYYSQTMYDRLKEENARLKAENDLLVEKYCKSNEFMC